MPEFKLLFERMRFCQQVLFNCGQLNRRLGQRLFKTRKVLTVNRRKLVYKATIYSRDYNHCNIDFATFSYHCDCSQAIESAEPCKHSAALAYHLLDFENASLKKVPQAIHHFSDQKKEII